MVNIVPTATFALRTYTEDGAKDIADFWCHRMEFLYGLWIDGGGDHDFKFTVPMLREYVQPAEVEAFFADGVDDRIANRIFMAYFMAYFHGALRRPE